MATVSKCAFCSWRSHVASELTIKQTSKRKQEEVLPDLLSSCQPLKQHLEEKHLGQNAKISCREITHGGRSLTLIVTMYENTTRYEIIHRWDGIWLPLRRTLQTWAAMRHICVYSARQMIYSSFSCHHIGVLGHERINSTTTKFILAMAAIYTAI